jgi:hypothetical protein
MLGQAPVFLTPTGNFQDITNICQVRSRDAGSDSSIRGVEMSTRTLLIILIVLLLLGALPTWPYSAGWGYYPSGGLGLVLLIVIVVALFG